jgi:hypothetical protein
MRHLQEAARQDNGRDEQRVRKCRARRGERALGPRRQVYACSRILTYGHVCSRMLYLSSALSALIDRYTHAHVCSRMLTYTDVCYTCRARSRPSSTGIRMLTYAHACSCMLTYVDVCYAHACSRGRTSAVDRRPLVGSAASRFTDQLAALSFLKRLVNLKVQQGSRDVGKAILKGTQFTCFTGTNMRILTPEDLGS